jgi:hypothetical protein
VSDENFLSRWSRRKQQEAAKKVGDAPGAAPAASDPRVPRPGDLRNAANAEPGHSRPSGAPQDVTPAFDLARLPDIDSITAETDITSFLQPGVPEELRHAAVRRAFAADPKIWNYIERADYDWDFNAPESAPGFGPLKMTAELRREVARLLGEVPPAEGPAVPDAAADPQPEAPQRHAAAAATSNETTSVDFRDAKLESSAQDGSAQPNEGPTAVQQERAAGERLQSFAKRGHGRALPR